MGLTGLLIILIAGLLMMEEEDFSTLLKLRCPESILAPARIYSIYYSIRRMALPMNILIITPVQQHIPCRKYIPIMFISLSKPICFPVWIMESVMKCMMQVIIFSTVKAGLLMQRSFAIHFSLQPAVTD